MDFKDTMLTEKLTSISKYCQNPFIEHFPHDKYREMKNTSVVTPGQEKVYVSMRTKKEEVPS